MAKKRAAKKTEEAPYLTDEMAPQTIPKLETAMKALSKAQEAFDAAKTELENKEAALQRQMEAHMDDLEETAGGDKRYLSSKLGIQAIYKHKPAKTEVKLKVAPKSKAEKAS